MSAGFQAVTVSVTTPVYFGVECTNPLFRVNGHVRRNSNGQPVAADVSAWIGHPSAPPINLVSGSYGYRFKYRYTEGAERFTVTAFDATSGAPIGTPLEVEPPFNGELPETLNFEV